jgi:hypothetical protein
MGCTIIGTTIWLSAVIVNRYTLKILFNYHGWMYESQQSKVSLKTKIWGGLVKVLIGKKPKLYSYQSSLPHLPVPKLDATIDRVFI